MGYDSFRQLWISGFNRSLDCTIDQPSFGRRIYKKSSAEIAQVRRLLTTLGQHQKSINGGLSDLEPEHQQFAMDPAMRPKSLLIRRINSRRPRSIFGRPVLLRDFQRQNALNPSRCHLIYQNHHRFDHHDGAEQPRPESGHPDQQRSIDATQPKTRRRRIPSQGDTDIRL